MGLATICAIGSAPSLATGHGERNTSECKHERISADIANARCASSFERRLCACPSECRPNIWRSSASNTFRTRENTSAHFLPTATFLLVSSTFILRPLKWPFPKQTDCRIISHFASDETARRARAADRRTTAFAGRSEGGRGGTRDFSKAGPDGPSPAPKPPAGCREQPFHRQTSATAVNDTKSAILDMKVFILFSHSSSPSAGGPSEETGALVHRQLGPYRRKGSSCTVSLGLTNRKQESCDTGDSTSRVNSISSS